MNSEVIFITEPTGLLLFASPNVEQILGYSQFEIQEKFETITQLLGEHLLPIKGLVTWGNNLNIELKITDKTGQQRTLSINIKSVVIGSEKLLYTCEDISPNNPVKPRRKLRVRKIPAKERYAHSGVERNGCEFHGVKSARHQSTAFSPIQQECDRRLAEEALRQSEESYRRIIETTLEGVWMIDESSRTTLVNQRMASMLGYTIEQMMGKEFFEFMDENTKAIAHQHVEGRRQGISEQYDLKLRRRDGSDLWVIVSTTPI